MSTRMIHPENFLQIYDELKDVERMADVGAGDGKFSEKMVACGIKIENVDVENKTKNNVPFHLCDVSNESLPFRDEELDAVSALCVIEHLENPWRFVREARRVLKSNGLMIVCIPHIFSFWGKIQFFWSGNVSGYHKNNNHYTVLTKDVQRKLFAGFVLKKVFYIKPYFPHFPRFNGLLKKLSKWTHKLFAQQACYIYRKYD